MIRMTQVAKALTVSVLAAGVFSVVYSGTAVAQSNSHYDTAQVVSATPVYERVATPRRECRAEEVTVYEERRVVHGHHGRHGGYREANYDDRSYETRYEDRSHSAGPNAGTIIGAVIGGAIGRQMGNSQGGRDRGTVAGAVLGGVIGTQVARDAHSDRGYDDRDDRRYRHVEYERVPVTRTVDRCETVTDYREEIRGYDVTYRYNGRNYTSRMPYDPGSTIQVDVGVRPVPGRRF
jgi:uncharacterized protein YcfJ